MPVGSERMGIIPTKSAGPKPCRQRLVQVEHRDVPAVLEGDEGELVVRRRDSTCERALPAGAGQRPDRGGPARPRGRVTRNTVIPLSPATSRYCRLWVNASPSGLAQGDAAG